MAQPMAHPSAALLAGQDSVFAPMTEADLAVVAEAELAIYPFPWTAGNFRDSLATGDRAWLWRQDGALLGYAVVNQVLDEAQLLNISILPVWQGRGLGRRLLAYLCDDARHHRASRMFLEVRPSNRPALALYEGFGFRPIGRRKGYYPAPEGREDAIVMELTL